MDTWVRLLESELRTYILSADSCTLESCTLVCQWLGHWFKTWVSDLEMSHQPEKLESWRHMYSFSSTDLGVLLAFFMLLPHCMEDLVQQYESHHSDWHKQQSSNVFQPLQHMQFSLPILILLHSYLGGSLTEWLTIHWLSTVQAHSSEYIVGVVMWRGGKFRCGLHGTDLFQHLLCSLE